MNVVAVVLIFKEANKFIFVGDAGVDGVSLMGDDEWYKIMEKGWNHRGFQYHEGFNELPKTEQWDPDIDCEGGGFYFCKKEHLLLWMHVYEEPEFALVRIPKHTKVSHGTYKSKANRIILKSISRKQLRLTSEDVLPFSELVFTCNHIFVAPFDELMVKMIFEKIGWKSISRIYFVPAKVCMMWSKLYFWSHYNDRLSPSFCSHLFVLFVVALNNETNIFVKFAMRCVALALFHKMIRDPETLNTKEVLVDIGMMMDTMFVNDYYCIAGSEISCMHGTDLLGNLLYLNLQDYNPRQSSDIIKHYHAIVGAEFKDGFEAEFFKYFSRTNAR